MNICIRVPVPVPVQKNDRGNVHCQTQNNSNLMWTTSRRNISPAIYTAFSEYKERPHQYREKPHKNGEYIVYRPDNDPYLPTYIAKVADIPVISHDIRGEEVVTQLMHERTESEGLAIPIMDFADISVFITDPYVIGSGRANWFPAREYQAWAYRDFMYDRDKSIKKSYMSRGTSPSYIFGDERVLANQVVMIDVDGDIAVNIVFHLARNENGSVYIERNDVIGSRMRICDNEYARTGYLGFYTRITMDPGMVVSPPPPPNNDASAISRLSTTHLSALEETDKPDVQCILCVRYRINARFSPCEHCVCCSDCYLQLSKNECPLCRTTITRIMNV